MTDLYSSWYCVTTTDGLAPGKVLRKMVNGQPLEVRNGPGGFSARLPGADVPVRTLGGAVFAWFDARYRDPTFDLPDLDPDGWTAAVFDHLELETRPEIIMRDLADYGHFTTIHGYHEVKVDGRFATTGPTCRTTISLQRRLWPGLSRLLISGRATSTCHGLGYQLTEVETGAGVRTRHRVMPTPTVAGRCELFLGLEVRFDGPLRHVPLAARLLQDYARRAFVRDIGLDADNWMNLQRQAPDRIDETLTRYWDWAAQFAA